MEEEHGSIDCNDFNNNTNIRNSLDSDGVRQNMERNKEVNQKPRPRIDRIVTDCC